MKRDKVFISYSHKDEEFLDAFRIHLKPWEDKGLLLDLWIDEQIEPSQDWHQKIQEALDTTAVAVLLVSHNFLASDYIFKHELPKLLAAREEGDIALTCLYLHHSAAADDNFTVDFTLSTGEQASTSLTKYQGLNNPDAVVEGLSTNERNALYVKAASEIRSLVARKARQTASPPTGQRFGLTIQLRRSGNQLTRTYFYHNGRIAEQRAVWQSLTSPIPDRALFETLFPSEDLCNKVLKSVCDTETGIVRPIRYPIRVRLQTEDPELAALPWVETAWRGTSLSEHGWTFELITSSTLNAVPDVTDVTLLKTPCPVLLIAPGAAPDAALHHRALEERLKNAWPFYHEPPQRAQTWEAITQAWTRRRPRIVYYYGPAETDGQTVTLLLNTDDGGLERRPATDLAQLWAAEPPQIVFFNFVETSVSVGAAMSNLPAALVVTQNGSDSAEARRSALAWFHEILEKGEDTDPVWEVQQHGLSNAVVWGAYGTWRTRTSNAPAKDTFARLLLDRAVQRKMGLGAISELVRANERRLWCVLAYGTEGNLAELFAEQLYEYLRRNAKEVAQVHRIPMRLPDVASFDADKLAFEVRRYLGLSDRESFGAALEQRKPRGPGRAKPVLLLDWGVRGTTEQNRLSTNGLEAWLTFCSKQLSAQCPKDLRLVSCLTLQIAKENHKTLEKKMEELRAESRFRDRAFRLELLPPLDQVSASDLADFLDGTDNSSCPDDLIPIMPDLIVAATDGQFEKTVKLVEQAEQTSWYTLHDELVAQSNQSKANTPAEDELL